MRWDGASASPCQGASGCWVPAGQIEAFVEFLVFSVKCLAFQLINPQIGLYTYEKSS